MAKILNYQQFIEGIADNNYRQYINRFYELAGVKTKILECKETYLIEITFNFGNTLTEHENIKNFKNTNNRYYFHPETTNPPVKAHYHVISLNGKNEIYAVCIDGTAHHKSNKGYQIPKKEAEELRKLGVEINDDRIIECIDFLETKQQEVMFESLKRDCLSMLLEIEV